MEIIEALTTYLLAQTGLTALIDRRFFYDELPQGTIYPAVVCLNISDVKDHTHDGQVTLERPVFQFTSYADTKLGAIAVGNQIKTALRDYTGSMSGIEVQYIKLLNELSSKYTGTDGTASVYTQDQEYEINFIKE